jgi:S1-C subfamily serine protease
MKRMACPACRKQLFVSGEKPGKRLPCPMCGRQLRLDASGLVLGDGIVRPQPARPVRPKPSLVPIVAPVKESATDSVEAFLAVPSVPPLEKVCRPKMAVPFIAAAAFFVAIATSAGVWLLLPFGSKPDLEDTVTPSIVNPLDPFRRKSETRRVAAGRPNQQPVGQVSSNTESDKPSGQSGEQSVVADPPPPSKPTGPMGSSAAPRGGDPIQNVLRSVGVVTIPGEGHGSAFVVAPRVVVTNHHVIEHAVIGDLQITFPDNESMEGRSLRAELIHVSIPDDLAFLAIDADLEPLDIKAKYEHVNGQRVVAIGSPGSGGDGPTLENLTTDGRLGPEVILDGASKRWSLSMSINGGNSGGPLVAAETGEVVGVIVAYFSKTEGQSLAIPHESLVRELSIASQASDESRAATLSLHRQRYCLLRMSQILNLTSFAFDRSLAAARANSEKGLAGMDAAFNEFKTKAANVFAEQFADFSGTVGGEVEDLQDDPHCDLRVRRGLRKLLTDIENQADEIRRRVPRDEISSFLGRFDGSVKGSRALVTSLSEKLEVIPPEMSNK